jgi:signal transduction histidine kinase
MRFRTISRLASWPAILVAGGAIAWLVGTGDIAESPWLTAALWTAVGLAWCFTGLAARRRRPANRTGALMALVGLTWFAKLLGLTAVSLLFTIGLLLAVLILAVLVHLLLAFPTGRLEDRASRLVVGAAYLDTTVPVWLSALFDDPRERGVENLVLVHPDAGVADALLSLSAAIGVVLLFAAAGILARRWRRATAPWRRVVAPVLWSGAAAFLVVGVALVIDVAGAPSQVAEAASLAVFAAVPFAFQAGLWRMRLARGAVADLVVELGGTKAPGELRAALARALGDPSLEIAYWLPERSRYVDVAGRAIELPAPRGARVATVVRRGGRLVAALLHDASLREDPELVEAACAAAGLALENERLQAELSARLVELQDSRARIIEAGDAARRRIERDLHDGAQQRLVSVSMALGLAESRLAADPDGTRRILLDARAGLSTALEELRELSQGIHPGVLTERGLGAALQELAYGAPVPIALDVALDGRLPEPVEAAAYFVVAEALANVAKHAAATRVAVAVERCDGRAVVEIRDDGAGGADAARGTGLRGLADRVDALGGTLAVQSPRGEGTRLRAEIPCGS